jgi:hypothetical protein
MFTIHLSAERDITPDWTITPDADIITFDALMNHIENILQT